MCAAINCSTRVEQPSGHIYCRAHAPCRKPAKLGSYWSPDDCSNCFILYEEVKQGKTSPNYLAAWHSLRLWITGFAKNHNGPYLPNMEARELLFPHASEVKVISAADSLLPVGMTAPGPVELQQQAPVSVELQQQAPASVELQRQAPGPTSGQLPVSGPSADPLLRGDEPAPMDEDLPSNPLAVGAGRPLGEGPAEAPAPAMNLELMGSKLDQLSGFIQNIQASFGMLRSDFGSLRGDLPSLVQAEVHKVAPPSQARFMPPPPIFRFDPGQPLEVV